METTSLFQIFRNLSADLQQGYFAKFCVIFSREDAFLGILINFFVLRALQNRRGLPVYNGPWQYRGCPWRLSGFDVPDSTIEDCCDRLAIRY